MGKQTRHWYVTKLSALIDHHPPTPFDTTFVLITDIRLLGVTGIHQGVPEFQDPPTSQNAFNSERPLNVKPTDQGGVAIDGRGDLPEGHANMADKVIGKMQKVFSLLSFLPRAWIRPVCLLIGHWEVHEQTGAPRERRVEGEWWKACRHRGGSCTP